MALSGIDLNLLVAFEAIYSERNVTRAARRLGLGQPAMSAALARLRVALGDELFVRTGTVMQPTPKAERIAPAIGSALAQIRDSLNAERPFEPSDARTTFTIASTDYTSLVLLPRLAAALRIAAPNVDLRVVGYEKEALAGRLARNEIDIALGVFPDPPADCVRSYLFSEHFVGLARQDHPAFAAGTLDLAAFAALPHALVTVRGDARGAIDESLGAQGLNRRVAMTLPHMMALPAVLRGTDLVAAVPSRLASSIELEGLRIFELPMRTEQWEVSILWSPFSRSDRARAWFRATVQAAVEADAQRPLSLSTAIP